MTTVQQFLQVGFWCLLFTIVQVLGGQTTFCAVASPDTIVDSPTLDPTAGHHALPQASFEIHHLAAVLGKFREPGAAHAAFPPTQGGDLERATLLARPSGAAYQDVDGAEHRKWMIRVLGPLGPPGLIR